MQRSHYQHQVSSTSRPSRGRLFRRKGSSSTSAIIGVAVAAVGLISVFAALHFRRTFNLGVVGNDFMRSFHRFAQPGSLTENSIRECLGFWNKPLAPGSSVNYYLPKNYRTNPVQYFTDLNTTEVIWQSDVYNIAAHFAKLSSGWIVDIGAGSGIKASIIYNMSKLNIAQLDFGPNLLQSRAVFGATKRYIQSNGSGTVFAEWDISEADFPEIGTEKLRGATIVASDVIEHLDNPDLLVDSLVALFHGCGPENLIISSIDRRTESKGPPPNPTHVREWTTYELERYLSSRGAPVRACAPLFSNNMDRFYNEPKNRTTVCLVSKMHAKLPKINKIPDLFPFQPPEARSHRKEKSRLKRK